MSDMRVDCLTHAQVIFRSRRVWAECGRLMSLPSIAGITNIVFTGSRCGFTSALNNRSGAKSRGQSVIPWCKTFENVCYHILILNGISDLVGVNVTVPNTRNVPNVLDWACLAPGPQNRHAEPRSATGYKAPPAAASALSTPPI
jgi:hypothetical protein